jgi:hypothetical protein
MKAILQEALPSRRSRARTRQCSQEFAAGHLPYGASFLMYRSSRLVALVYIRLNLAS